jgi:hypothetical protein
VLEIKQLECSQVGIYHEPEHQKASGSDTESDSGPDPIAIIENQRRRQAKPHVKRLLMSTIMMTTTSTRSSVLLAPNTKTTSTRSSPAPSTKTVTLKLSCCPLATAKPMPGHRQT